MKKLLLALLLPLALGSLLRGAAAGLPSISFTTSQAQFAAGDSITIREVLASSSTLGPGTTLVVRGDYTLQSRDSALLAINLTSSQNSQTSGLATSRKQITAGSGTFELEFLVQAVGTVHVTFYSTVNGASFGGIYFAGSAGGTPTNPNPPTTPTTPTVPTVTPPINTAGLVSVPFATSRIQFASGDGITIQEVLASSPRMEPGDTVVVRGQYTLQSQARATLMVSLTVNAPGSSTPTAPTSRKTIDAGTGGFELEYRIQQPGALHVTFYPWPEGSSFGGVYFAPPAGATASNVVAISNPPANIGKLGNLSVRSLVGSGEGALVAGISVTDQERYVLIRGVGPSLAAFGVTGTLRKPTLTVHAANGEVVANASSWSTAFTGDRRAGIEMLARSVGAFPLTVGSDDAVLNLRLVPGTYTVTLTPGDGQSGVAVLEVYASSTFSLPTTP